MGWINFVILPKYKIGFQVSRHMSDMHYYDGDMLDIEEAQQGEINQHKKFTEFSLEDLRVLLEKGNALNGIGLKDIPFWVFDKYDDVKVITEMDKDKPEYSGYVWVENK